jgi:hypothetical protein
LTVAYADERREESHSEVSLAVELFWARDGASWERAASSATEEKHKLGILNLLNANVCCSTSLHAVKLLTYNISQGA